MLWTKESDSSVYLELLKNKHFAIEFLPLNSKKNNKLSASVRSQGNHQYSRNDIKGALVLYNKSICFAEINSENSSLAYGNRSMCFLKLNLYDECLADIQLAERKNCPESILLKLKSRKEKCIQMGQLRSHSTADEPKSACETNDLVPYVSSALKIHHSQQYGRMFMFVSDIDIGETILVEETYMNLVRDFGYNECSYCNKQKMSLLPCDFCSNAMFCSEECKINNIHEYECGMVLDKEHYCDGLWLPFVLRSVVIAINSFFQVATN